MKKNIKCALMIILMQAISICGYAQSYNSNYKVDLPKPPFLSPEAASLGKYGEIPVSEYTGVPQIEIPLYTVKSGELELPITLSYHASGIKVNQEATWVGLGWDLMAGGCISRIVSGSYDDESDYFIQETIDSLLQTASFSQYSYLWETNERNSNDAHLFECLTSRSYEPDILQANFCGHSFSFYIDRTTRQPVLIGKVSNNYKISFTEQGQWASVTNMLVTDNSGIKYYFGTDGTEGYMEEGEERGHPVSWFLTKIEHPVKGTININYGDSCNIYPVPSISQSLMRADFYGEDGILLDQFYRPTMEDRSYVVEIDSLRKLQTVVAYKDSYMYKHYISSIQTENEIVEFHLGDRDDIYGDSRKIEYILVKDLNNNTKKGINFDYSYFISPDDRRNEWNQYSSYYHGNCHRKRLRLDAISINDENYFFEYNDNLPTKTSYSQDFWGYYNGQKNKSLICTPNLRTRLNDPNAISVGDANRYASNIHSQAGILTSIIYPTLGLTNFTYEANTFNDVQNGELYPYAEYFTDSYLSSPSTDGIYRLEGNRNTNFDHQDYFDRSQKIQRDTIFIPERTVARIRFEAIPCCQNASILKTRAMILSVDENRDIEYYNVPETPNGSNFYTDPSSHGVGYIAEKDTILNAGTYILMVDSYHLSYCGGENGIDDITHVAIEIRTPSSTSYGGGLRIKEIRNYDEEDRLVSVKTYDYSAEDGNTSGVLVSPLPTLTEDILGIKYTVPGKNAFTTYRTYTQTSSASIPAFTSAYAIPVGYRCVTVKQGETKTKSYYDIQPVDTHNASGNYNQQKECAILRSLSNGNLIERFVYNINDEDDNWQQHQTWLYSKIENELDWANIYAKNRFIGPAPFPWTSFADCRYVVHGYPFTVQRISLVHEVSEYKYGDNILKHETDYSYETTYHLPSLVLKTTDCEGIYDEYRFKYPHQFMDNSNQTVYQSLIDRNMISSEIEAEETLVNASEFERTPKSRSMNVYSMKYGKPVVTSLLWAKANNPYTMRMCYEYDNHFNIVQAMRNDSIPTTYLWAYNNSLPVASIVGLPYADYINMTSASMRESLGSSFTPSEILENLRGTFSNKNVLFTTTTYDPFYGILSQSSPNRNTTTYEYDNNGYLILEKDYLGRITKRFQYNFAH